jgi:hypothetical protein
VFLRFDTATSCGDLIFSGHSIYSLTSVLAVTYYFRNRLLSVFLLGLTLFMSVLLIAGHRHYTVDILLAWYIVPLVWTASLYLWPDPTPIVLACYLERMGCAIAEPTETDPVKTIDMVPLPADAMTGTAAVAAADEDTEVV